MSKRLRFIFQSLIAWLSLTPVIAQGFTINLPADAAMIKLQKGLANMALTETAAQGPALNGIIFSETDKATSMMYVKLYDRPREVTLSQIKEDGYLFVRYLIPLRDLKQIF